MKVRFLYELAEGRLELERENWEPPFCVRLSSAKARILRKEMAQLETAFAFPFSLKIPTTDDEKEWEYIGTILGDLHCFERRGRAASENP